MKRVLKRIVVLVVVAALILFAVLLIHRKKQKLATAPRLGLRPVPVHITVATAGTLSAKIDYLAVVEPIQKAQVAARLTATVDRLRCNEGDIVKVGDVLIELDTREIRSDIASAQAEIARTEAQLAANQASVVSLKSSAAYWQREADRDTSLAKKGDIPGSQAEGTTDKASEFQGKLEAAIHQSTALQHLIEALKARQSLLETRLSYGSITSPYNGLVTQRLVDPGDLAAPGKILLVIEDRHQLKLVFDIPQADLSKVREGQTVSFPVRDQIRRVSLSHLFPALDPARMLRAEVYLAGDKARGLTPGQTLTASVVLDAKAGETVVLPASTLVECPKHLQHVFVVKDGILTHHKVTVLASANDQVAVTGIEPNDVVVTNTFLGWTTLSAGKKVEVLK